MNTFTTDLVLPLRVKCPKRGSKIAKEHVAVVLLSSMPGCQPCTKSSGYSTVTQTPSDAESFWAVAGIWAGSSQVLILSSSAALPLVLPLQHVPVLLEALTKGVEGLREQFQSGTDLIIAPHLLSSHPALILCPRDLVLFGLAG